MPQVGNMTPRTGLWRYRQRRLEAEIVRDAIMTASGGIDLSVGGPPVFPFVPEQILLSQAHGTWRNQPDGPAVWRRSVYVYRRRPLGFPFFDTFDLPDQNVTAAARHVSTVPTQALTLLNNPFLLDLGFGKRFHPERFTPHLDRFTFSEDALELRAAMSYPPALARTYVDNGWWAGDTLTTWLERHARERSDAPAIQLGDLVVSYGELRTKAESVASTFHRLGLARGDVVAIQLPNVPEFLIAYLALARLGAVTMTLHMPYRAAECETLLRHSRARAVICSSEALEHMPKLEHVITLEELRETITSKSVTELPPAPVASDPFLLLYTSGTTSSPKGVPLNYHNMLSNARLSAPEHGLTADGVYLSAAPFTHLYGLYSFHAALAVGASNLLLPSFKPPELVACIESGRPTAMWTAARAHRCLHGRKPLRWTRPLVVEARDPVG